MLCGPHPSVRTMWYLPCKNLWFLKTIFSAKKPSAESSWIVYFLKLHSGNGSPNSHKSRFSCKVYRLSCFLLRSETTDFQYWHFQFSSNNKYEIKKHLWINIANFFLPENFSAQDLNEDLRLFLLQESSCFVPSPWHHRIFSASKNFVVGVKHVNDKAFKEPGHSFCSYKTVIDSK